jgi:pyruvate, orthophosphate dikinase
LGAAEFFSFGTNYLTRTTFGISCDDAGSFLPDYRRSDILEHDSFMNIDVRGVGELVRTATKCGGAVPSDNQAEHLRRARQ